MKVSDRVVAELTRSCHCCTAVLVADVCDGGDTSRMCSFLAFAWLVNVCCFELWHQTPQVPADCALQQIARLLAPATLSYAPQMYLISTALSAFADLVWVEVNLCRCLLL